MNNNEIKKWLEKILNTLAVSFTEIQISTPDSETALFSIETPESGLLIGNSGETLSALNHLIKRAAEKKGAGISERARNIALDINGYRKKNEERIKAVATMLGDRAAGFKYEVAMEPMGSYERRVVHAHFQNHPNLTTESRGFGKGRFVVIKYTEVKKFSAPKENEENDF